MTAIPVRFVDLHHHLTNFNIRWAPYKEQIPPGADDIQEDHPQGSRSKEAPVNLLRAMIYRSSLPLNLEVGRAFQKN